MDALVLALGPAFACGFAVQHLLEVADPAVSLLLRGLLKTDDAALKKVLLLFASLFLGAVLVAGAGLRVLGPLGMKGADGVDALVTVLIVSAGTEGFNSLLKFLGYAKETKKAENVQSKAAGGPDLQPADAPAAGRAPMVGLAGVDA